MAFHLAEYRVSGEAPVRGADLDDSDFAQLGTALDLSWRNGAARLGTGLDTGPRHGHVGMGASRRLPVRTAVDFAVGWLAEHRNWVAHDK
jgi:hypothetical protein